VPARLQFIDGSHLDVNLSLAEVVEQLRGEREFVSFRDRHGGEYVVNPVHVVHIEDKVHGFG
jgi:predicted ATP-grasp superfamily ATP-dependent carboligase